MEWLELSLAGRAVTSPPRSREAPRSRKCGLGPAACRAAPWFCSGSAMRLEKHLGGCVERILPPGLGNNVTYWRKSAV